ncbi:hypothetical protein INT44_000842 [Umbelopsis vinacea]|uniref:Uncharacterized protein n=1 Tax=Umbelopsis vinacea TaxID=44442 RepID=A0A8H7UJC4_9FUNG|nr:hypothetical protein INT44_000842 [Umbelopsis vinacea]
MVGEKPHAPTHPAHGMRFTGQILAQEESRQSAEEEAARFKAVNVGIHVTENTSQMRYELINTFYPAE